MLALKRLIQKDLMRNPSAVSVSDTKYIRKVRLGWCGSVL
jgi:hypothetical protein